MTAFGWLTFLLFSAPQSRVVGVYEEGQRLRAEFSGFNSNTDDINIKLH